MSDTLDQRLFDPLHMLQGHCWPEHNDSETEAQLPLLIYL